MNSLLESMFWVVPDRYSSNSWDLNRTLRWVRHLMDEAQAAIDNSRQTQDLRDQLLSRSQSWQQFQWYVSWYVRWPDKSTIVKNIWPVENFIKNGAISNDTEYWKIKDKILEYELKSWKREWLKKYKL